MDSEPPPAEPRDADADDALAPVAGRGRGLVSRSGWRGEPDPPLTKARAAVLAIVVVAFALATGFVLFPP